MADDRKNQIAAAVEHLVRPGEAWVIRRRKGDVEVEEEGKASLSSSNPELYGRLLQVNESIKSTGGSIIVLGMLAVLAGCLAIHMQWLDSMLGSVAESLRSFWLYGLALAVAFYLLGALSCAWERMRYRQLRLSLVNAIQAAGLTPHRLMAEIDKDKALSNVAEQVKKDPEFMD